MRRTIALGCVVVWMVAAGPAAASEQSELLYSRGLVEFHADHYDKALALFDQAVAADSNDIYARYYRAVTRARLNDMEGAVADLRIVLAAKPDLPEAQVDLGVALVQTGHYSEAEPWLKKAQAVPEFDGQASLFLGIAELRQGELAAAQENFERAEARDPKQAVTARYYLGVTEYQMGKLSASQEHFTYVAQVSPDTEMGREAGSFLERIQTLQSRWQYAAYGSVGFQYDSNVPLLNSTINANLGTQNTKQEDGALTIGLGGAYIPWQNDLVTLSLGYDFYQSVHFELSGFNLQDHGPSIQASFTVSPVQFGVLGRYDYYMLENNSFLQEATALPWLTVPEDDHGRFEFYSRIRRRDFKNAAYYVLDSFDYAVGIRQVFYLGSPDRFFSIGYQFDRDDPVIKSSLESTANDEFGANGYGYDGNELNVGAGWLLPYAVSANGTFSYRHNRYKPVACTGGTCTASVSPMDDTLIRRKDDEYLVTIAFSRPITQHLNLILAYLGDYNSSHNAPGLNYFSYDRSIGSVAMEVRF